MDNRVRIVIDMYHERFDISYHKEQGNDFLLKPSALENLMNVIDHVRHINKSNYSNIEHYTSKGKLNYLQHLYVVFTELTVPAQIEMNAEVKALVDIFNRYYEKNHTEFKKQSDLITEVFYSYFDNQNDDNLPSKIAHNNELCKNQTFERFLQSVIDRADDAFDSFYSLPFVEIEEIFQSTMKSNTVDDS